MTRPQLILASGSSYKQVLMERLGVLFEVIPADIDETPLDGEEPKACAIRLADQKAAKIAKLYPHAWVVGCDQVIALDGMQLHKPGSVQAAITQLSALQGHTHDLFCSVSLHTPHGTQNETVHYSMDMRPLTMEAITRYVAQDQPLDCAGSYTLEAHGIQLFSSMRGDDYTAIVGLPLTRVHTLLERTHYFSSVLT